MRNIPFAFVNEETIDQINRADRERRENVNAFANLAETQKSMRGLMTWPQEGVEAGAFVDVVRNAGRRLVAMLEKMMEISGPNSIANLERALRSQSAPRRER